MEYSDINVLDKLDIEFFSHNIIAIVERKLYFLARSKSIYKGRVEERAIMHKHHFKIIYRL